MNVKQLIEKYKSYEGKWNAPGAELARQIFIEDLSILLKSSLNFFFVSLLYQLIKNVFISPDFNFMKSSGKS